MTTYCACRGGGFVVADDRGDLRCLRCGRKPAPPPCPCRLPARSPRPLGVPDWCQTCRRPIDDDPKEAAA